MAVANRAAGQGAAAIERLVHDDPAAIYALSVRDRERTRALLRANAAEPDVLWLDVESGQVLLGERARRADPGARRRHDGR